MARKGGKKKKVKEETEKKSKLEGDHETCVSREATERLLEGLRREVLRERKLRLSSPGGDVLLLVLLFLLYHYALLSSVLLLIDTPLADPDTPTHLIDGCDDLSQVFQGVCKNVGSYVFSRESLRIVENERRETERLREEKEAQRALAEELRAREVKRAQEERDREVEYTQRIVVVRVPSKYDEEGNVVRMEPKYYVPARDQLKELQSNDFEPLLSTFAHMTEQLIAANPNLNGRDAEDVVKLIREKIANINRQFSFDGIDGANIGERRVYELGSLEVETSFQRLPFRYPFLPDERRRG